MSNKTCLITGITGMLGSFLAEILLYKNYIVYGLVRNTSTTNTGRLINILGNKNLKIVSGDITDAACLSRLIQSIRPDELYNLAAESSVATSFEEPSHTWDVTAKGFLNIVEAVKQFSPQTKVFQASSSEIFGDSHFVEYGEYLDINRYQNEYTPLAPKNPYAVAKAAAHQLAKVYRDAYKLHISCGIFYPNESYRRGDNFLTRKVTKYIGRLTKDPFFIGLKKDPNGFGYSKLKLGNINAYKSFGHAKDFAYASYLILQQNDPTDYIISNGYPRTVEEFIKKAFSHVGLNYKDFIEIDPSLYRPLDNNLPITSSPDKLRKIGWNPKLYIDDVVAEMVNFDMK